MIYNISENLQRTQKGRKFMLPNIHENSELVNVEYKVTPKSEFIAFYFENELKEQMCHTEWKIRETKPLSMMTEDQAAAYLRRVDEQIARIHRIMSVFIDTTEWEKQKFPTFEAFCNSVVKALGDSYKGKKVRIKVVYDMRNFTSLPKYVSYQWIESMDIPKEKSKIEILNIDKLIKTEQNKPKEGANEVDNKIETFAAAAVEPVFEVAGPSKENEDPNELPF